MSKVQDRINQINKIARRSRIITTILAIIIIGFIIVTGWNLNTITKKNIEITEKNEENAVLITRDSIQKINLTEKNRDLEFLKKEIEAKEQDYKKKLDSIIAESNSSGGEHWEYTVKTNTVASYYSYIETIGIANINETRVTAIKSAILELMNYTDWVQIIESNGADLFSKSTVLSDFKDVRIAKSARSVRKGVMGLDKNSRRNGHIISKGQYIIVLETKKSGRTLWARIKYSNKG